MDVNNALNFNVKLNSRISLHVLKYNWSGFQESFCKQEEKQYLT